MAKKVAAGEFDRGILICGTGIGMSIAANKVKGIRCALVHDTFSARATREHNDTNMLSMGERVIGAGLARDIVKIWLAYGYARFALKKNLHYRYRHWFISYYYAFIHFITRAAKAKSSYGDSH